MDHIAKGAALAALLSLVSLPAQGGQPQPQPIAAQLAEAKLHEARGELAAAEALLRQALAAAQGNEKEQVAAQLAALLQRQGRAREAEQLLGAPAQEPRGEDPLRELVMMLDRDLLSEGVDVAKTELDKLGPLAVPALLQALPKFGPFGLTNALELLANQDDPRIGPALADVAESKDPSVALALAQKLTTLQPRVRLALAKRFANPQLPQAVQLHALAVLVDSEPDQPATRELALRLAAVPDAKVQEQLLTMVADRNIAWSDEVLDWLRQHGLTELRAQAMRRWLLTRSDLQEPQALAVLQQLPGSLAWTTARDLAATRPAWVHTALLALRGISGLREDVGLGLQFARSIEWWRAPEASARGLLQLIPRHGSDVVFVLNTIREFVARGWHLPEELDSGLARCASAENGPWNQLIEALPANAEARALKVWQGLDLEDKSALARAAVYLGRPWHHLVAQQLALPATSPDMGYHLLDRDWTGVAPEDVAVLADLPKRWSGSRAGPWQMSLASIYVKHDEIPLAAVLPVMQGQGGAFRTAARRDPQGLLAWQRDHELPNNPSTIAELCALLQKHGSRDDVPLALSALLFTARGGAPAPQALIEFLHRCGGGDLDVIRLGLLPLDPGYRSVHVEIASGAARQAKIEDLEPLLAMLPDLDPQCAAALCASLAGQVRPGHAAILARTGNQLLAALDPVRGKDDGRERTLAQVLSLLQNCGGPTTVEVCKSVLATPGLRSGTLSTAVRTAIAAATDNQRALLAELLASDQPAVVEAALIADALRDDERMQQLRREAVLRLGDRLNPNNVFAAFDGQGRQALADAVLASPRYASFQPDLCRAAVEQIGKLKDPTRIPQLAAAAGHPDYTVRCGAARALGLTFSREAAAPLIEMLKDESQHVREAAQQALDQIASYLDARAKWEQRLK